MRGSPGRNLVATLVVCWLMLSVEAMAVRSTGRELRRRVTVATILVEPYMMMKPGGGLWVGNEKFEGYYADLIASIARIAGFDYQLRLVPDGKIGTNISNSWNGIIGEIVRGSADIALAPIIKTPERSQVVGFTIPVSRVHATMVMKKDETAISSLRGLLRDRHTIHGVIHSGATEDAMENSNNRTIREMYDHINVSRGRHTVRNVLDGIERVRRENFVLLLDSDQAEYVVQKESCDLKMVGSFLDNRQQVFATALNDPLLRKINSAIRRIQRQAVEFRRLVRKWWPNECDNTNNATSSNSAVPSESVTSQTTTTEVYRRRPLVVASALLPPYLMKTVKRGREKFHGFFHDVIQEMASDIGFEYEFRLLPEIGLSEKNAQNHTIQEILNGNADIALVPFTFEDVASVVGVSFTRAIFRFKHTLLQKRSSGSRSLLEIVQGNRTKIGILNKGGLLHKLYHSRGRIYELITQQITRGRKRIYASLSEALNRMKRRNFALILEEPLAAFIQDRSSCSLQTKGSFLRSSGYKILLRSGFSDMRNTFNKAIKYLHRNGTIARLQAKWWDRSKCGGDIFAAISIPKSNRHRNATAQNLSVPTTTPTTTNPARGELHTILAHTPMPSHNDFERKGRTEVVNAYGANNTESTTRSTSKSPSNEDHSVTAKLPLSNITQREIKKGRPVDVNITYFTGKDVVVPTTLQTSSTTMEITSYRSKTMGIPRHNSESVETTRPSSPSVEMFTHQPTTVTFSHRKTKKAKPSRFTSAPYVFFTKSTHTSALDVTTAHAKTRSTSLTTRSDDVRDVSSPIISRRREHVITSTFPNSVITITENKPPGRRKENEVNVASLETSTATVISSSPIFTVIISISIMLRSSDRF